MTAADALHWRRVTDADLPALLPMMAAFADGEAHAFDVARAERSVRDLLQRPSFGGVWLILEGGTVIGYLAVTLGYSFEFGGHDAFVDEIYVVPARRGGGIGTRSMQYAEQAARELGATALHLEASRRADGPVAFYSRAGYRDRGYLLLTKSLRED